MLISNRTIGFLLVGFVVTLSSYRSFLSTSHVDLKSPCQPDLAVEEEKRQLKDELVTKLEGQVTQMAQNMSRLELELEKTLSALHQTQEELERQQQTPAVAPLTRPPSPIPSPTAMKQEGLLTEGYTCPREDVFLYHMPKRNEQGLGSCIIQAMVLGTIYEKKNRTLVVNEEFMTKYRYNKTHGLFQGFIRPHFPVLSNTSQCNFDPTEKCRPMNESMSCRVYDIRAMRQEFHYRRGVLFRYYRSFKPWEKIWEHVLPYACEKFPFELYPHVQDKVDELFAGANMSDVHFDVAFHIRRTDSDRAYRNASLYLQKYMKVRPTTTTEQAVQNCFVSTDDAGVIQEMQQAMTRIPNLNCNLYTLTNANYKSDRKLNDMYIFLAQLHVMIQADYFVGTMRSNVASAVTLWRGCLPKNAASRTYVPKRYNNHFNSYGVDMDSWQIP